MSIRHSHLGTEFLRPDAEIEQDIKDTIYADVRLISENIEIEVEGGVARLRGSVPKAEQKALARVIADRIKGVRKVTNELAVIPPERRSDADITADVVSALTLDTLVDEDKINVTTIDRVVHMEGTVASYAERKAAYDDARQVAGVVDVINGLVVTPVHVHDDEEIARNVKLQIEDNLRLEPFAIDVQVKHGVAYLRGNAASVEQRWLVGDLARWTPGVIDVVNELVVVAKKSA